VSAPVGAPSGLRERIAADLEPVRPLASPLRRAAWVGAAGCVAIVIAAVWARSRGVELESALVRFGWVTATQWVLALALVTLALREAVPALGVGVARSATAVGGAVLLQVAFAVAIGLSDGTLSLGGAGDWPANATCASGTGLLGVPLLALAIWLVFQEFPLRARWSGALAGAAAGLFADGAWHLACGRTDLGHVLVAHVGVTTLCAALGYFVGWRSDAGGRLSGRA